jgi:hypothetical protein
MVQYAELLQQVQLASDPVTIVCFVTVYMFRCIDHRTKGRALWYR